MRIISTAAMVLALCIGTVSQAADSLILGVQDYGRSPRMLALEFKGLANYLSQRLGQPVMVEAAQSYERYLAQAQKKRYTFMYGPPSMAIEANRLAGYEPVAKIPGTLSASFMSLGSSEVAFPEDMKGRRIGMPDANSLVTRLALAKLRSMKIDPQRYFASIQTFSDADDVIGALKLGLIDVGVANSSLFNVWSAKGHNLNVVLTSESVPHLTFSVRADLPAELKAKAAQAMRVAHKDKDAQSYFKYSGYPGFEPTSIKDYQSVIKLLAQR